ncbi:MAG: acetylxylan esterase [Bryobacterales bacterium]|nr:acetylxylan esterase [Bryobacterales bacterium]
MPRYFSVWDGIRAFDYMLTRKEIDPERIVVAGNSGGGTQSAYLGVADPRLAGVIASCYPTTWRELWAGPGPQDMEQVTANWLRDGFDFSDFMIAVAPRPYLISSALRDYFPIAGARRTFAESKNFYTVLGEEGHIQHATADQNHGWTEPLREAAYGWFARHFDVSTAAGPETVPIKLEDPETIAATSTGQLLSSVGTRTTRDLNRERAAELRRRREQAQRKTPLDAAAVRSALQMRTLDSVPAAQSRGSFEIGGVRVEKLELETEAGVSIPAFLYLPSGGGKKPATVFASSAGKGSDQLGQSALALARAGQVVLAVDPRGMGEAAPASQKGGYSSLYQLAARTWLMGESLAGMQVNDVLASVRFLKARREVDADKIALYGQGSAGPLMLFAAAINPEIKSVTTERSLRSFDDLVNAEVHRGMENLIVPGLLETLDLPELTPMIGASKVKVIAPVDFAKASSAR